MNSVAPPDFGVGAGEVAAEKVRTYQAWEGNNKFCLGGRLIFGPDIRSIFGSIFLIVAPVAVFCVFVARKLMDDFTGNWGIAIMVVCIAFTLYVLILLLVTSGRDPGIVPRNADPPEPEEVDFGSAQMGRLPRTRDVEINGITVKVKYCDTCKLYRPPRCSHCSICDNCVERFDHHCPWVGQCIGLRNYRFFFMFIFSATLLCLYVHGFCWVYIVRIMNHRKTTIWKAMAKTPASIVLIVYSFLILWFVGGLSVFHLYLIATNQSTYENFRYRYTMRSNPYNKGIIRNFMEVFCSSVPPSKNKFRAKVQRRPPMPSHSISAAFSSMRSESEKEEQGKPIWGESADRVLSIESDQISLDYDNAVTQNQHYTWEQSQRE